MSYMNDVDSVFGLRCKEYCRLRQVTLKKVNEAFEVPSESALLEDAIKSYQQDTDTALYRIQKKLVNENDTDLPIDKEMLLSEDNMKKKKKFVRPSRVVYSSWKSKMEIRLCDSVQTIPTRLSENMTESVKMSVAKSGKEVLKTVKRYVAKEDLPALISVAPQLCEVLEAFRINHRKFKHYSCLHSIVKTTQKENNAWDLDNLTKADVPTVKITEINSLLIHVVNKVVPKQLFGTVQNKRSIVRMLMRFISLPPNARLSLIHFSNDIKIKFIPWLGPIQDEKVKRSIFGGVLLWFFKNHIEKLLHSLLIILTRKDQRVFFRRWDWHRLQQHFLRKQMQRKVLLGYEHEIGWKAPKVRYKLLPDLQYNAIVMRLTVKRVRPVITYSYSNADERRKIRLLDTFLRQLYVHKYDMRTFQEQWRSVKSQYGDEGLHLVSTDVRNAYGSIMQEKLFDFIKLYSAKLPEVLHLVNIGRLRYYASGETAVVYKEFFSDLALPFSSRTLYQRSESFKTVDISKKWILGLAEQFILRQRVFIGNRIFIVGKGVLQGAKVSPILSDIYYASIQEEIKKGLPQCQIVRYVDDIMFVSSNKTSATRFFDLTKTGIEKYGCYFNKKTFTNLSSAPPEQHATYFKFLGMLIDSTNLELLPDFKEAKQPDLPFKSNSPKNIPFIVDKLRAPHYLRLPKMMLDSRINSVSRITKNVSNAFMWHRSYLLHIVTRSFTEHIPPLTATRLLKAISIYSMRNMRRIIRYILECEDAPGPKMAENWMRTILHIVLTSYEPIYTHIKKITQVPLGEQEKCY